MRTEVKDRNGAVSAELREYAEKKVGKLARYFHHLQQVTLHQSAERGRHIVELSVEGDGVLLRSEVRDKDVHSAVDSAVEKMETQVKRFKDRLRHGHQRPGPVKESVADLPAVSSGTGDERRRPRIVRRKRFPMKPMSAEEAATLMEMVSHDFFLFENEETGAVSVLYRRQDGDYGLIEPER